LLAPSDVLVLLVLVQVLLVLVLVLVLLVLVLVLVLVLLLLTPLTGAGHRGACDPAGLLLQGTFYITTLL